jgi:hypothetical protein
LPISALGICAALRAVSLGAVKLSTPFIAGAVNAGAALPGAFIGSAPATGRIANGSAGATVLASSD